MDPNNQYYNQWLAGQQSGSRRFLPVAGTFAEDQPHLARPQPLNNRHPFSGQFPQGPQFVQPQQIFQQPQPPQSQAAQIPLIPLSAVEELQPPNPLTSGGFQDPFNRAYAADGPAVFEGFIPAPGREDEDDYSNLANGRRDSFRADRGFESSDEEDEVERMLREAEEEEELRQIEEKDDSEVDGDYSSEDAQHDEGDPDEMELLEDFEDEEERVKYKRSKSAARGLPIARGQMSTRGTSSTRSTRGGKRGRPPGRGRGGHHGSASTRGGRGGKRGRPAGSRGPRRVADPGGEFKELQRQANERFIAKDYETALGYAQKAIQLNPEIFDAYNITSEIYAAMGEEESSIAALIAGAPTKRDAGLWHFIIERINKLDPARYPDYSETAKTSAVLACLNQIILLNDNYEARSHKLEIEARLGHASKCMVLGLKMLKTRKEQDEDPDVEVLKIMAMMGTSTPRQTRMHLDKLMTSFDEAIEVFTDPDRDPADNDFDWEMINIYLDLLDRKGDYSRGITQLRRLARWKQGRREETYWDDEKDDREFDIEDEPRRVAVSQFRRKSQDAKYGQTLPLEIRIKLGLFRLRRSADDFLEAMRHLEMLEPDRHGPEALVWDYEDLFRIIADALHATGHDKDALRYYTPLHAKNSSELNLMSYIGLHTCYKNQEEDEKAAEIIPILQKWPAENYDELAVLAKFFEDHEMWQDSMQRAETIYRDKYGHKLKRLGFKAYDEMRVYYYNQRRQARGRYGAKKRTARRNRKMMKKATAQQRDDVDSAPETGDKELPSLGQPTERPKTGLFRTKRTKAPKTQTFLPVDTISEPMPEAEPKRTTLEGTDVPLRSIDHRFFRKKLEKLAADFADDLTAARAQHREILSSFDRLERLAEAAEDGDENAVNESISITRELIEEFSTFDLFYFNKKEDLTTYFRRIGSGDIWKESALMILAVVANNVEDGQTDPELKERPDAPPRDFWGIHFDRWCDAFGRYALLLAREGDDEQCFATLDIAIQANVFYRSRTYHQRLQLCRLACALAADNSKQASIAVRWLLKEFPFGTDLIRLYSAVNRLCSFPEGYATGPAHKAFMRYVKTMDYALLSPEARIWYNFRNSTESTGGFHNGINIENVSRVKDHDPALLALYGHILMCGGSYMAALNYYFRAYAITPQDPMVNMSIGVAYIQHAMKRLSENRQYQIQQGLAFTYRYYELRTRDGVAIHCQEAEFNVGRMWHGLGLVTLALPAYERCIKMSESVRAEAKDQCSDDDWGYEDFAKEAAFAIQSIYAISGNVEGARKVTEEVLVIE
ncbi:TPR-like protein [Plenodomus tracheiphilus IPT5]|uniref:TPR-like protein n=1 Tax=Plenodomus tracheiphilus IPT5 TaxID=1408161 RepID=A0A6A7B8Z1_9PLEO|nr:TPR-like protein [Plenodomus tracheiphilus IPT5]